MRNDLEIQNDAFKILFQKLECLKTKRFISLTQKNNFD